MHNQLKVIRSTWIIVLLALSAVLISACSGVPASNWAGLAVNGNTVYMSHVQLMALDATNGTLRWSFPDKADQKNIFYAPAVVDQDIIYAANYNNEIYALNAGSGQQVWAYKDQSGKGRFIAGPVVAGGLVLTPSTDHYLYALDLKGSLKWKFKARNPLWSSVATDGKLVYLPGMDHYLYAIDLQTGQKAWELDLGASMLTGPTLGPDGMLYQPTIGQEMVAVNTATHKIAWRAKLEGSAWSSPLLDNGTLYLGTDKNKTFALSAQNGAVQWKADSSGPVIGTPAVVGETLVFTTESGGTEASGDVFSLDLKGAKGWTRSIKGKLYAGPMVSSNRVLVAIQDGDALMTSFDANGNQSWTFSAPK